jgi:vacuolar-type H+-ATPase subunit H
MDYFSQLANMGGLASQYEGDLAQRANEITENTSLQENYNQVQDQFKNAQSAFQQGLASWNYIAEGDKNQGIDELKMWGIEVGSEFVASKVGGLYAGSALQKSIGGLYDAGTGYVKSAFQSALQTGKDTLQGAVEKGSELVNNAITEGTNTAQSLLEQGTSTVRSAINDGTSALSSAQQTAQDFVRSGQQTVQDAVGGAQQTVQDAVSGAQQTVQDAVSGAQQTVQDAVGGASDFANPAFGMANPVSEEDTEADFTNPTFYGGGQSVGNTQQMFNNPLFDEASASPDMSLGTETATTAYRSTAPYLAEQAPAEAPAVGTDDMMNSLLAQNARPTEEAPTEQTAETPAPAESTSNLTTVEDANQTVENTNENAQNTFNTEENTYNTEETTYKSELNTYENPDADPDVADPLEDLGEDALEDTATSGFGVGEALMAGQLLYTGVKALYDYFDPPKPPPPPTAPTVPSAPIYQQVQALPSYIQASAQSGV